MRDMPVTIEVIRALYPEPRSAVNSKCSGGYCVGGALMQYLDVQRFFPPAFVLCEVLCGVNTHLSRQRALVFAVDLIEYNDKSDMDSAWDLLRAALEYKR